MKKGVLVLLLSFVLAGCSATYQRPELAMDQNSVLPGGTVTMKGQSYPLVGVPLEVGFPLLPTSLVDANTMESVDLTQYRGSVLLLSIVPSLDTPVCEAQTHILAEEGDRLPADVRRIVISRDLPFAQKRFAKASKLTDVTYLSDYKAGTFGKAYGVFMKDLSLLARSIVLVDKTGTIRYFQITSDLSLLPDMEKAFDLAAELAQE